MVAQEAAIVSAIPGTTRDVIHREIQLDGMPVRVIDTAGLRDSDDPVEREGVRRAWREIEAADLVLLLADPGLGLGEITGAFGPQARVGAGGVGRPQYCP